MKVVAVVHDALISGLFRVAAAIVVSIFLVVIADVATRNIGAASLDWASAYVEYCLLVSTMGAAPWLIRKNAHISVEILTSVVSTRFRWLLGRLVAATCAMLCLVLTYYAYSVGVDVAARGEVDIRSITIPRWVLYAVIFVGMSLSALEFARQAFSGAESNDDRLPSEGL